MVFVLGTDEAGYGPNLGPLCVAATAWQMPDDAAADGLYDRLADVVCVERGENDARLAIADSKSLYKSGGTLQPLRAACLSRLPRLIASRAGGATFGPRSMARRPANRWPSVA